MNPYWLIEFYSISGLIPIPDFMKPASAGRFSLKCGSYLFIQACGSYLFIQATHRKVTETFLDEAIGAGRSVICFVPKVKSSYYDIDLQSQIDM